MKAVLVASAAVKGVAGDHQGKQFTGCDTSVVSMHYKAV